MIKLAIETTDGFSISIDDNGDRYDFASESDVGKTSELLWEQIGHIKNKSDIAEIYLSSGPSNYTNLRIIYSFAMGVRKATGAHIYTIPSFMAKANYLLKTGQTLPFILINYARNNEYCYQIVDKNTSDIDWQQVHLTDKAGIEGLAEKYKCITNKQTHDILGTGEMIRLNAASLFDVSEKYKKDSGLIYARASV